MNMDRPIGNEKRHWRAVDLVMMGKPIISHWTLAPVIAREPYNNAWRLITSTARLRWLILIGLSLPMTVCLPGQSFAVDNAIVVRSFIDTHCVGCHNSDDPLGALDLTALQWRTDDPQEDAREAIERFAQRAFRRPLKAGEADRFVKLAHDQLDAGGSYQDAVRVAVKATLVSLRFLVLDESPGVLDDHALANGWICVKSMRPHSTCDSIPSTAICCETRC